MQLPFFKNSRPHLLPPVINATRDILILALIKEGTANAWNAVCCNICNLHSLTRINSAGGLLTLLIIFANSVCYGPFSTQTAREGAYLPLEESSVR